MDFDLYLRVTRLYADYAAALDSAEWDKWPGFFLEDCTYKIIQRENLLEHVKDVGAYLEQRLKELAELPLVGDVRCQKLMACVEFVADKRSKTLFPEELNIGEKIHLRAQKRGLLVRPIVHLNVMSPPLTITREQVDEVVDTLREAILETAEDLKRSGDYAGH